MSKPTILVTRKLPSQCEEAISKVFDATFNAPDLPLSQKEIQCALQKYDALLVTVTDKLNAATFDVENINTKIIANYGVGVSHIDLSAAKEAGITITNTPDVLSDCTADIAITLMLMCARRTKEGEREIRDGEWSGWYPTHMMGTSLRGKTLGIIGFGRIGQTVAQKARLGFGMNIIAQNRSPIANEILQKHQASEVNTIDELLRDADFVSLHCPGGLDNKHLINAERLKIMKESAILINTARGEVIDESALAKTLLEKKIAGAGLDVFEEEPKVHPDLLRCENAVLLPHLGSATKETRVEMGLRALENLNMYFAGNTPKDIV